MNKEVEIQVKIKNLNDAEKKIRHIGKYLGIRQQIDYYFTPPNKNYFSINQPKEYIRVRDEKNKSHFMYSFLRFDKKDPYKLITTYEYKIKVEKPLDLIEILKKIGLKLTIIVKKQRKYFDTKNFLITLDKINGLGNFIEIEAKKIIKSEKHTKDLCLKFLVNLKISYFRHKKGGGYPRMLYLKKYKNIKFY